jgi:type IV pilus assembly protein PilM
MGYGIDIGTTALKVVAARRVLGGYRITTAARRRISPGSPAEQKPALLKFLHDALGGGNGHRAGVVGLSGRDINLQIVQQPAMKALNYRVMMGYELEQRKGQADDVYLDFCTLREPDAYFPQYLALIGIGKSSYVDERIEVASRSGLDVRDAVPNAFALFSAYRNAYDAEGGTVLLLDIGSDNMDLAFVRGGRLIFARNVSSGARVFDHQVAGALGCSAEDAEALKVARGNLGPAASEAEEEDEIRPVVRSAAGQLAGFITSSINHAKVQLNDRELSIDKVYVSGGGARVRGLPEYLTGALKVQVELLDPFRKLDTSAVDRRAGEGFRRLPTDLAVAIGLAQLVSPSPGTAASTLSILPDGLRKRRNFFRTTFWLGVAGGALAVTLACLAAIAFFRKSGRESELEDFQKATREVRERIAAMEELSRDQRELAAKADSLLSHVTGGRVALDVIPRLKKALQAVSAGVGIDDIRLVSSAPARGGDGQERQRAAFTVRRRGLVIGELEPSESSNEIKLKGQAEPFKEDEIVDGIDKGVIRWPAGPRGVLVSGEVDENIRGGARETLNAIRDQLSDPSRGVRAAIQAQKPSDKPGWRRFEILITFD